MDQKINFGGTIGYGDSYLEFLFSLFKVFSLHGKLNDDVGAVWTHSGRGPGYCYMIRRGPNSCLVGHVSKPLFCRYVDLFLPFIFNTVDF